MSTPRSQRQEALKTHLAAPKTTNRNLELVLKSIRAVLKKDYPLYEECVENIVKMAVAGGDAAIWYVQMQQLVRAHPKAEISHAGVLFLLEDRLGMKFPELPSVHHSEDINHSDGNQSAGWLTQPKQTTLMAPPPRPARTGNFPPLPHPSATKSFMPPRYTQAVDFEGLFGNPSVYQPFHGVTGMQMAYTHVPPVSVQYTTGSQRYFAPEDGMTACEQFAQGFKTRQTTNKIGNFETANYEQDLRPRLDHVRGSGTNMTRGRSGLMLGGLSVAAILDNR